MLRLSKVEDVKLFVQLTRTIDGDVNVAHDHYVVDGKSLLGLMSLDLSEPIKVSIISSDDKEVDQFIMNCKNWIVE